VDHHLIADLTPTLAALCLGPNPKLRCSLSSAQQAILLALGLRRQTADEAAAALKLPVAQLLALFAKAVRKLSGALAAVHEAEAAQALPRAGASAQAAAKLRPLAGLGLDAELREGGAKALSAMRKRAADQAAGEEEGEGAADEPVPDAAASLAASGFLEQFAIRGTDDDWADALKSSSGSKSISIKDDGKGEYRKDKKGSIDEGGHKRPKHSGGGGGGSGKKGGGAHGRK